MIQAHIESGAVNMLSPTYDSCVTAQHTPKKYTNVFKGLTHHIDTKHTDAGNNRKYKSERTRLKATS